MFCLLYFFMQLVKMMVEEIFFVQKAFICSNLKSPFGPPKYNRISYAALTLIMSCQVSLDLFFRSMDNS
jgi:hypothetical protein